MNRITYILTFVVSAFFICSVAVPLIGITTYTYGGDFKDNAFPLQQGEQWIQTAQQSASQAPAYAHPQSLVAIVEQQISRGWVYINESDSSTGVKNGSPCWFFATPQQTYGYVNVLLYQSLSFLGNLTGASAFLNNSQFQASFGVVYQLLGNVDHSLTFGLGSNSSIEGCIYFGEWSWFAWLGADIALFIALVLFGVRGGGGDVNSYFAQEARKEYIAWRDAKAPRPNEVRESTERPGHKYIKVYAGGGTNLTIYDDGKWKVDSQRRLHSVKESVKVKKTD